MRRGIPPCEAEHIIDVQILRFAQNDIGRGPVILSGAKDLYESFIALTDRTDDRALFMRGVDASYRYEGYNQYRTEEV